MNDATAYLTRYSCPLFIANKDRSSLELVGTSVPISVRDRHFLITAGHVLTDHHVVSEKPVGIIYPGNRRVGDLDGLGWDFVGRPKTSSDFVSGFDHTDLGILEIPSGALSQSFSPVPIYMVAGSVNLNHVDEITLIGYPRKTNKYRPNSRKLQVKSAAYVLRHERGKYEDLELNPLTHFCARFDHKGMMDESGRVGPRAIPHGFSGGPAWYLGETAKRIGTDEGVALLGIVSEYDKVHKVIWGPRMSYLFLAIADAYPDIADGFAVVHRRQLLRDPEDARNFLRAIEERHGPA